MIAGVTDFSLGQLAVAGLLAVGLVLLGRLGWIVIDLAIDAMHRTATPELLDGYADTSFDTDLADAVDLPGDREHSWPHKVIPPIDDFPAPAEPVGFPDLDEDQQPANPSGRHSDAPGRVSVDQVTGYVRLAAVIPAPVDDTVAMAAVAAVSGQDGPS